MKQLDLVELLRLCAAAAVVGFGLYAFGYHVGRLGARLVEVPVDEFGRALFVQAPANA